MPLSYPVVTRGRAINDNALVAGENPDAWLFVAGVLFAQLAHFDSEAMSERILGT